jgi:hypothetical protein
MLQPNYPEMVEGVQWDQKQVVAVITGLRRMSAGQRNQRFSASKSALPAKHKFLPAAAGVTEDLNNERRYPSTRSAGRYSRDKVDILGTVNNKTAVGYPTYHVAALVSETSSLKQQTSKPGTRKY